MKKIIKFLKNWFEKNGLIKILISFIILVLFISLYRKNPDIKFLNVMTFIVGGYIVLTALIFITAGFVNMFNDIKEKIEEND